MTHSFSYRSSNTIDDQQGSVLVSVLVVIAVLLTIFLSVLTYGLSRHSVHIRSINEMTASYLAESGIQRSLSHANSQGEPGEVTEPAAPNGGSFESKAYAWGPHWLIISKGAYNGQEVVSSALVGSRPPKVLEAAVTVTSSDYPLVVTGNTRIIGDVNTGPAGITEGRIRGEGIVNRDYLQGENHVHSSINAPQVDSSILRVYDTERRSRRTAITSVNHGSLLLGAEDTAVLDSRPGLSVDSKLVLRDVSLSYPTTIKSLFAVSSITIDGDCSLSGLLEIASDSYIKVEGSSRVSGAVLYAPDSIVISDHSYFAGTAVTPGKIVVSDSAVLDYPACLIRIPGRPASPNHPSISLLSRREHRATVVAMREVAPELKDRPLIYIDTSVVLSGYILSEDRTDLRGSLLGSVATESFHYELPPTTYVNWAKDVLISRLHLDHCPPLPIVERSTLESGLRVIRLESEAL